MDNDYNYRPYKLQFRTDDYNLNIVKKNDYTIVEITPKQAPVRYMTYIDMPNIPIVRISFWKRLMLAIKSKLTP